MIVLLAATIKISVIVGVALSATRLLRRRSAALRHWVLAGAMACGAASPVIGLVVPAWNVDLGVASSLVPPPRLESPGPGTAFPAIGGEVQTVVGFEARDGSPRGEGAVDWLVLLWVLGSMTGLGVLVVGVIRLRRIDSRSRRIVKGGWVRAAEDVAHQYGLAHIPLLLESDDPALLVTWGFRQPRIILPAGAQTWTDERIHVVVAHELAHVVRRDWLLQTAAESIRSSG